MLVLWWFVGLCFIVDAFLCFVLLCVVLAFIRISVYVADNT